MLNDINMKKLKIKKKGDKKIFTFFLYLPITCESHGYKTNMKMRHQINYLVHHQQGGTQVLKTLEEAV